MAAAATTEAGGFRGWWRLWLAAALVLALDQGSKVWVARFSGLPLGVYPPEGGIELIPGFLSLVYVHNLGAAWGILPGQGQWLALLALAALYGLWCGRHLLGFAAPPLQWVAGLLAGGIAGNLVDRTLYGYVIDFVDVLLPGYRWPTFNVADSAIVVGTGVFIAVGFWPAGARPATGASSPTAGPAPAPPPTSSPPSAGPAETSPP